MSPSSILVLRAHAASPGLARAHVSELVGSTVPEGVRDSATLIVSELVTNAVMHGREPIRLRVDLGDELLRLEVFDSDADILGVAPPERPVGEGGLGLRLVATLAVQWGVESEPDGKTVWATMLRSSDDLLR